MLISLYKKYPFRVKRMLRTGLAIGLGVLLASSLHIPEGYWIPMTLSLIMQASVGATLQRSLHRILGTFIGVALGIILLTFSQHTLIIDILLVASVFLTYLLRFYRVSVYGLFVVLLTLMTMLIFCMIVPTTLPHILWARFYNTAIACVIAVLITQYVLPYSADAHFHSMYKSTYQKALAYLEHLLAQLEHPVDAQELRAKKWQFNRAILALRRNFVDQRYENILRRQRMTIRLEHIFQMERLFQMLLSLESTLKFLSKEEKSAALADKVLRQLQQKNFEAAHTVCEYPSTAFEIEFSRLNKQLLKISHFL